MRKFFGPFLLMLVIFPVETFSQPVPSDRAVLDSLTAIRPHNTGEEMAGIYLEAAEMIRRVMPQRSLAFALNAFRIGIQENNLTLKAKARMQIGEYYVMHRRFLPALEQYLAARLEYRMAGDSAGMAYALVRMAVINRHLQNERKALVYLQEAYSLVEKTDHYTLGGMIHQNMANAYQAMGDYEAADYFYQKAIQSFRSGKDVRNELFAICDQGSIFLNQEKYDDALAVYSGVLDRADPSAHELKALAYTRIGHCYYTRKDYTTSLTYNRMALKERYVLGKKDLIASALINLAGDYLNLNKFDSGQIYLDSGMAMAARIRENNLLENAYRHLYTYYLENKNFVKALDLYARHSAIRDQILRERNYNNIAILESNQALLRTRSQGQLIARQHYLQSLMLKYQEYQSMIMKGLVWIALSVFITIVVWLLYVRHMRRKMQALNIRLSREIRERETAEEKIRQREAQYKFITDHTADFITHIDSHKKRAYASPSSRQIYGYEPDEILSKTPYDLTHPDYIEYAEHKLREMVISRQPQKFTYPAIKKDGTVFWVESISNPFFDHQTGEFKGMVGVTRDIQERKNKELEIMEGTRQKENLLKEIHHRVKNNFAILVSLINMQMAQTRNPELLQSLTNLQLRIRTMSLVHEMLYRSSDFEKISFPGYLRTLASVIAGTYNRRDIMLDIEAEEAVMDIESSIPLGLVINELLSNAYKHAFPEGKAGTITIRFKVDPDTGFYTLVIKDDGVGMPGGKIPENIRTMGLQIVQILCTQIEGKFELANTPGAEFTLIFNPMNK